MTETFDSWNDGLTHIAVARRALVRCGCPPISDFGEASDAAASVAELYPAVVETILGEAPWRCARHTAQLSRLSEAPSSGWAYAYDLPADRLGPPESVFEADRETPLRHFALEGKELHADDGEVWVTYVRNVAPDQWPSYLRAVIVTACAADFARVIADDAGLSADLYRDCFGTPQEQRQGGLMGLALAREFRSTPARSMPATRTNNPLISARG